MMIKKAFQIIAALAFSNNLFAQRIWQQLSFPTAAELASHFKNYPVEYAETLTWGWDGVATRETIAHDLDGIQKQGLHVVTIECGYRMGVEYLSEGWFEKIKIAVEEAKKRNMRMWIIDEGKYPSGFAGGKFSRERPDLRMQGIDIVERINVPEGGSLTKNLDPSIISAVAVNQAEKIAQSIDVSSGKINWKAPPGKWQVLLARHRFRTSVTRAANNLSGGKDTVNSLCDYLDPAATKQFLEFTHVQYKKYIGDEFGKTVLGFRGDEPEFNFTPWTPKILSVFKEKKGYDIAPFIASFFTPFATEKQKLAKADFWDVWSDLFRDNFFKVQSDWCNANNLEYMVHIDHEDKLMDLVRTEGDYFKAMRYVGVPGVDAIWNQIWYDKVSDFPKLASSAAHMYGRPRALSESFAAYNPRPTVDDARWVINHQLVRGINLFEYMFWPASASGRSSPSGYLSDAAFPSLAEYSNRASFILSSGKPAAQIGVYMPTESMWLGNANSNTGVLKVAQQLLEHQLDFDFVDAQGIASVFSIGDGKFKNASGQTYSTVIIPSVTVMSEVVLNKLQAFARSGGQVIFAGTLPSLMEGRTFVDTKPFSKFNATFENDDSLTSLTFTKIAADVLLESANASVKYLHRKLKDADLYFFFNEEKNKVSTRATLIGNGKAELWDAASGQITSLNGAVSKNGKTNVPLDLDAFGSRFIIIKK